MTDTTDIEALASKLRKDAKHHRECWFGRMSGPATLTDAAAALERQQAVVVAARKIGPELQIMYDGQDEERKRKGGVGSHHRDRFESWVDNLDEELAALDAPPEGGKP